MSRDQIGRPMEVDVTSQAPQPDALLTPAEVAALFRVDPKTVTRWAKSGKLTALRTLGGHRRFLESEVRALIDVPEQSPSESD
jgi:excisionase family DNA binding protein